MKTETILCISSFFTFWGDRMWQFAVGIFLIQLTPGSLRLAATYGLVLSLTAIVLSPMIGDWIDRNVRLKVVRILLFIQNFLVVICAVLIYLCMEKGYDEGLRILFQVLIIIVGSSANLASQGMKIAIGKDWIVVVCGSDNDLLASTNALLRRIDLTVAILAPLAVGFLMSFVSALAGIIFICVWNILSLFVEYGLLLKVFQQTPSLNNKGCVEGKFDLELEGMENYAENDCDVEKLNKTGSQSNGLDKGSEIYIVSGNKVKNQWNLWLRFKVILSGWQVYYRQSVFLAGCTLAMLYLTVIGFSTITTGFAYQEGLSEAYVSICMGLGSVFGVLGTIIFPMIRGKIGLVRTGMIGFLLQWSMLLICGVSIWLPGSPSNLYNGPVYQQSMITVTNNTVANTTIGVSLKRQANEEKILTSVIVLMVGIVLSRTGLWLSDLTITQLQQEYVAEKERGIVGGVQYSSNCVFDVGQFVLTIILPTPEQFGILILISISAITLSGIIYISFINRFKPTNDIEENDEILTKDNDGKDKEPISQ